jgi:predicted nucleotidyltransferase component of viral defense system
MLNPYSDLEEEGEIKIQSYGLEEIVIEKMAALMGRTIPRDLYDFEYLTNTSGIELQDVFYEFQRKARNKGHNPGEFVQKVTGKERILEKFTHRWRCIRHRVRQLPDGFWTDKEYSI